MNAKLPCAASAAPLLAISAFLTLTGCVKQQNYQPPGSAEPPAAVAAPSQVVVDDDYVYYPEYEVYYSNRRHLYGYRDGSSWAWRPSPPRVDVDLLLRSPNVHLDFHDSPDRHHSEVVRRYPHNWKPSGKDDHHDDRRH